jgi:hypothetical protein
MSNPQQKKLRISLQIHPRMLLLKSQPANRKRRRRTKRVKRQPILSLSLRLKLHLSL